MYMSVLVDLWIWVDGFNCHVPKLCDALIVKLSWCHKLGALFSLLIIYITAKIVSCYRQLLHTNLLLYKINNLYLNGHLSITTVLK